MTAADPPEAFEDVTAVPQRLINAAVEALIDQVAGDVTAKRIAEIAGVNHGNIHHYFGSKDELLAQAMRQRAADLGRFGRGRTGLVPIGAAHRHEAWRTIAHLSTTSTWHTGERKPDVLIDMITSHAADASTSPSDSLTIAEVAAAQSMAVGWWIFQDMIVESLRPVGVKFDELCAEIDRRSVRLLDPAANFGGVMPQRTLPPATQFIPDSADRPKGPDEVSQRLIEAAATLLAGRSVNDVANKEIAALAAVNHGQIHHNFVSKEHLVAEAIRFEGEASGRLGPFPLPLVADDPHPLWRSLNHLAATVEWGLELARQIPIASQMVEFLADWWAVDSNSTSLHGQVAAILSLEFGWGASKERVDAAIVELGGDQAEVYHHLGVMSCRLPDSPPGPT